MAKAVLIIDQPDTLQHLISFIDVLGKKLQSDEQLIASTILGVNSRSKDGKYLVNTDHGQLEVRIRRDSNLP